ncbi:MAG TPA: response regulator transcription factor [Candidatus Angelobacter sp.]|jgi:two-component system phosphate regulon response regulator PhoB|nr:response regulator transcription factor [Candidatus Angelobacter sp.]
MGALNRTLPGADELVQEKPTAEVAVNDKQKIFVVEDDTDIARLVRHHLEVAGYRVRSYSSTHTVLADAIKERPALMLLDIMVPGGDGIELCRQVRQSGQVLGGTPIVFLTARSSESDRIRGLETGADDYITKPFSPRELVARVKAVLRRCETPLAPSIIRAGDLEIDAMAMTLTVRGLSITATATEFRLLHYLAQHAGRVFTRDQILDAVWRETTFVSPRSVDVYVRKLRSKIEADPEHPRYLRTVRGAGYRFEAPKK